MAIKGIIKLIDKCHNCGNEHFEEELVSLTIEEDNKIFKIDNIPAKVCKRCSEEYFTAETYKTVYKMINSENRNSKIIEAELLEFVS